MHQVTHVPVAMPGLTVARTRGTELYVGIKDTFMLSRMEEGASRFWTHGREWSASRGSMVVHQPGDVHRDLARSGFVTYQIIRLAPALVEGVPQDVRVPPLLVDGDPRGVAMHRLHEAVAANANRFALECAVAEAVDAMTASDARFPETGPVRRALALIRERLDETITLDELAKHARLDKFHLCRAFRAQVGMPPHAYQVQLRVLRAKELLADGVKAKDIAARVGFYDQAQLTRHFRKIVGTTPARFARG
jgi:AraC-like DNA-binding protein